MARKKSKSQEIIDKLSAMSDEEFLNGYSSYYKKSCISLIGGIIIIGLALFAIGVLF